MRGHETYPEIALDIVEPSQKLREGHLASQIIAVGVDVLSEQHYLLVALTHEPLYLGDDVLGAAAALSAADIGHYAVGAEVVAAEHYRHTRLERASAHLLYSAGEIIVFGDIRLEAFSVESIEQQPRQSVYRRCAEYEIDLRIRALYLLSNMALSRHAARNADDELRFELLELFHASDYAENSVLGVFPDSAGIEYDKVGFVFVLCEAVACIFQYALYLLTVRSVELTAEAPDVSELRLIAEQTFYLAYYSCIIVQISRPPVQIPLIYYYIIK